MNLENGSTVGGYPILHQGNIENYINKKGYPNSYITVSQADNLFLKIVPNFINNPNDGLITIQDSEIYLSINGIWTKMILKDSGRLNSAGTIIVFAGNRAPEGFLECNGAQISRRDYSNLFNNIGTLYGRGNGSSTFNIPDMRGEFVRGTRNGRGAGAFENEEILNHSHDGNTRPAGRHRHTVPNDKTQTNSKGGGGPWGDMSWGHMSDYERIYSSTDGGHEHDLYINNSGDYETRPKNISMMYCIKI